MLTTPPNGMVVTREGDKIIVSTNPQTKLTQEGELTGPNAGETFLAIIQAIRTGQYVAEPGLRIYMPKPLPPELNT